MPDIPPHFAIPLRVVNGRFATVEQDSPAEVAQCVDAVTRYEVGSRLDRTTFGIVDPTFATVTPDGVDTADIADAIVSWEPRALDVLIEQSSASVRGDIMRVALRLRSTEGTPGA